MKFRISSVAILSFIAFSFSMLKVPRLRADEAEPGVARISVIHGDVSTMRGDTGDWVTSSVNAPLVQGDQVLTSDGARTEIQLDYANVMRLAQRTQVKIANLSRNRMQVQVSQGLASFDVLRGADNNVEIDTPNVSVHPLAEGEYRIQVESNSQTEVIVRNGEAEVSTPQGSTQIKKGQMITIQGTDNPEYQIADAPGKDDFDRWNHDRDKAIVDARSWQYANQYYTGADDLDSHGHWVYVPGYDWCWTPYVDNGWVPYRDGRWVWEPYYGWTWVSYEPWGWAPYHYGRWFSWGGSWCWWPGPVYPAYYPVWAPAYVSFFGFGFGGHFHFGFGFGFGFGNVGWLPIGPRDPFCPWYGFRGGYNVVNVTNITNITNVTNINNYHTRVIGPLAGADRPAISNIAAVSTNARLRGAITAVPGQDFGKGFVMHNRVSITPAMLKQGQLVSGRLPVEPTRASLAASNRPVPSTVTRLAHSPSSQRFFTREAAPAGPKPFTEQAAQVRQMIQSYKPPTAAERRQTAANFAQAARPAQAGGAASVSVNAHGFNTSAAARSSSTAPVEAARPGWRSFGAGGSTYSNSTRRTSIPTATSQVTRPRVDASSTTRSGVTFQSGQSGAGKTAVQPQNGWRRFGSGSWQTLPSRKTETPVNGPVTTSRGVWQPKAQSSPDTVTRRAGWQGFSQGSTETSRRGSTPVNSAVPQERSTFRPQQSSEPANGWHKFTPSERPASNPGFSRSESAPAERPGWGRFSPSERSTEGNGGFSRGERPAYSQPSRGSERPPLEFNRPIVTERAPRESGYSGGRSYGGGGGYHGGGAPSHMERSSGSSSGGGGGRSYSAPSSGGHHR